MVLQLLAAFVGAVLVLHRQRPDAAGDAADHRVFRIHAIGEEEGQVRGEIVDVHAARQIVFDVGEAVGKRESELRYRIGPGFGNVIAGNRHRVEVLHLVMDEVFLNVAHHLQCEFGGEDAGVLPLILFQNVRLHRAAHGRQGPFADFLGFVLGRLAAVVLPELGHLLVDGSIEKHRQNDRRRAVDGHRDRCCRGEQVEAVVEHLAGRRAWRSRRRSCRSCRRCPGARRGRSRTA